ncbi:MAG: hypothetical protein JNJ54_16330 [Myxococcaceae bacterium]|nr:hypothetical protein [Myxococcaceae bacterium]
MRWRLTTVVVVLLLAACRDEGRRLYEDARARHVALVERGERPDSKAFDDVLALLAKVPKDSARSTEARALEVAITNARVRVRQPLARLHADDRDLPADLKAQTRACASLAELLARDGGATPAVVKALDDCRRRIEALDKAYHDAHEPLVDDVSQRLDALLDAGVR